MTLDDAWQAALAAEHQAVFGYGVLGPHLAGADQDLAYSAVAAHESLRDATESALAAVGQTPVAPRADYPQLYPAATGPAARRLAVTLEDDCAAAWRFLYLQAASDPGRLAATLRGSAQTALTASAIRAARWRQRIAPDRATTAFPGT
jgi:Domain of unknown function (DUF4439)